MGSGGGMDTRKTRVRASPTAHNKAILTEEGLHGRATMIRVIKCRLTLL